MPVQFGLHAANKEPYADEEILRTGAGCTTVVRSWPSVDGRSSTATNAVKRLAM